MLIDTHCHLTDEKIDLRNTLERAKEAGIEVMIMPSVNLEDAKKVVTLATQEEKLYALVGIHPEEIENIGNIDQELAEIQKLTENKKVVGVGEVGLDFYFDKEKKTKVRQLELLEKQIYMANERKLPVVIHMREAEEEMVSVLKKLDKIPKGQFHCFAGSNQFLNLALSKGFCISFAGNITYKSADNLREMVHQVPLERLLLETDSPYLSPDPMRGTVNEPSNVKITAEFIAKEINVELSKLAEITSQNAKCLYSLDI